VIAQQQRIAPSLVQDVELITRQHISADKFLADFARIVLRPAVVQIVVERVDFFQRQNAAVGETTNELFQSDRHRPSAMQGICTPLPILAATDRTARVYRPKCVVEPSLF